MYFKKNKKGDEYLEGHGFGVIMAIVILLVSLGIIILVVKNIAAKSDEKLQVETCRASNAIKFGLQEKTQGFVSIERACTTIDKTEGKMQVPTKDYPQSKEGAESEIRDMIKNCWYMWLEGSEYNMFNKHPFAKSCFVCYKFKIEPGIEGVTFSSLEKSMNEPFFAADISDNCAGDGGYLREDCETGEKETKPKDEFKGTTLKCCIKTNIKNECENKGGKCSDSGAPDGYTGIYNKWSCPKVAGVEQSCYVTESSEFSYIRYVREYGSKGGDITFFAPQEGVKEIKDIAYEPGKIYAISFVSPSEQFCAASEEADFGCYAMIGAYAAIAIGAVVAMVAIPGAPAAVGTFIAGNSVAGAAVTVADIGVGVATGKSITGWAMEKGASYAVKGISNNVPNSIIVSTLGHAQEMKCAEDYGG
jgi:hypothetical protein